MKRDMRQWVKNLIANEKKPAIPVLFLYRKLLKSVKIVYNRLGIKNRIAKERRLGFAMTLSMKFFVSCW